MIQWVIEGSLEVKLPTIWTVGKAEVGRVREEKRRREKIREKARKGRKVAIHCVFPMICGSGGSKSRLAKVAGAEPAGQMRDEKVHVVVAQAHFEVKMLKNNTCPDHFWTSRCRKVRAVAARSTFPQVKMYKAFHVRTTFGS